jgi:hypothetical protein
MEILIKHEAGKNAVIKLFCHVKYSSSLRCDYMEEESASNNM